MYFLIQFAPILWLIPLWFLSKFKPNLPLGWAVLPLPLILFAYYFLLLDTIQIAPITFSIPWIPSLDFDLAYRIDGLSLFFLLLITGVGSIVVFYSIDYFKNKSEKLFRFYTFFILFMFAMIGIVTSDELFLLYFYWELTSITSFFLIAIRHELLEARTGALKALLLTGFGGLLLLGGFILLSVIAKTSSVSEIIQQTSTLQESPYFGLAMVLLLIAMFSKSAQFPFHFWLPSAMAAPTPVSTYLHSATMVKAGIFLALRFTPIYADYQPWFWSLLTIGLVSLLLGGLNSIRQSNTKAFLANSTISQLGYGFMFIAFASIPYPEISFLALTAIFFHLLAHSAYKGTLFMTAGIMDTASGKKDFEFLRGIHRFLPVTFVLTIIASLAMAGIPPLNGFLTKEMFLKLLIDWTSFSSANLFIYLFFGIALFGSFITLFYSLIYIYQIYSSKVPMKTVVKKVPSTFILGPVLLIGLVILSGIFPSILTAILQTAFGSIYMGESMKSISLWHGWTPEFILSIVMFLVVFLLIGKWKAITLWVTKAGKKFVSKYSFEEYIQKGTNAFRQPLEQIMDGYLRKYILLMFIPFLLVILIFLFFELPQSVLYFDVNSVELFELLTTILIVIASASLLIATSRYSLILLLGVVGYGVSALYVLLNAPDLALTQIIIETVSIALFLLAFGFLPQLSKPVRAIRFRLMNTIVSITIGVIVMILVTIGTNEQFYESISSYYIENAFTLADGKNIVNVILVDFRGFDTLFEITVLGIAAIGTIALIRLRLRGK